MLEPAGFTTIWDETRETAVFPEATGAFHRVSFALNGIVCALALQPFVVTGGTTEVRLDKSFLELLDTRRDWFFF